MSARRIRAKLGAFWELTKPNITMMVLVSTSLGYYMAAKSTGAGWDSWQFLRLMIGSALSSGGVASLNEYWERRNDHRMRRTRHRPLPSGRLAPWEALFFGVTISVVGVTILGRTVHPLTGLLAAFTLFTYIFIYTPLKTRTTWNTIIGAVPGALPPVGGWIAASGQFTAGAGVLFAILFSWQIPHFLAIAKIYRVDYGRGGLRMLPTVDPTGRAVARHIIGFSIALLLGSLVPTYLGLTSWPYLVGAGLLGVGFLGFGIEAARHTGTLHARRLLWASIIYLPVLLALMVADMELFY